MSQPPYPPPPYPPQMPYPQQPPKKSGSSWVVILLVVLGALVALAGIFGVLAIYGVRKYIANAKTAEARNSLGQIAKDASEAFERDGKLCASASAPIPAAVPHASKYQSSPSEWEADKARNAGFSCLGFAMDMPQYYQYEYTATADAFTAIARGDLDGDGVTSEFKIEGKLGPGNTLTIAPTILETNPEE